MIRDHLESLLQKAVADDLLPEEQATLDDLFAGRTAGNDDSIRHLAQVAASIAASPLASLPLHDRVLILVAMNSGVFRDLRPFAQGREKIAGDANAQFLFQLMGIRGFVEWATAQGILDAAQSSIWRFLLIWLSDERVGIWAPDVLSRMIGHEGELSSIFLAEPSMVQELAAFLRDGLPVEHTMRAFNQLRQKLPWLNEVARIRFELESQIDVDTFLLRLILFVRAKCNEALFQTRILPPLLAEVLERANPLSAYPDRLRLFLLSTRIELIEDAVMDPTRLPDSSSGLLPETMVGRLIEGPGLRQVDGIPRSYLRPLKIFFREVFWLKEGHPWTGSWQGRFALLGMLCGTMFLVTGLGTVPALACYLIAAWRYIEERYRVEEGLLPGTAWFFNLLGTAVLVLGISANLLLQFDQAVSRGSRLMTATVLALRPWTVFQLDRRNGQGFTPLQIARQQGNRRLEELLASLGAKE